MKRIAAIALIALALTACAPASTAAAEPDPCYQAATELAALLDDVSEDVLTPMLSSAHDAVWMSEQVIPLAERQQEIQQGVLAACVTNAAR